MPYVDKVTVNNTTYDLQDSALKSEAIKNFYNKCDGNMPAYLFERGSITNGVNDSYREGSRARTINVMEFSNTSIVGVKDGRFHVVYYNTDGTYSSTTSWFTSTQPVVISAGQKFRIVVSIVYNAAASRVDSIEDMVACLVFYTNMYDADDILDCVVDGSYKHLIFARGTNDGNRTNFYSDARMATTEILKCSRDLILYNSETGVVAPVFFDSSGNVEQQTGWTRNDMYIPAGQRFALTISPDQNSSTFVDESTFWSIFSLEVADNKSYSLSPNVTLECRNVDSNRYPPYTKFYIQAAVHNQYDRVRVNVRVTTDGYYVLIHDDTINTEARNTDGTTISTTINSSGQTLSTLNSYDWGIKYGSKYAGLGVPMLEDAMKYCAQYNIGLTIETSDVYGNTAHTTEEYISGIQTMLNKYGLAKNTIIITANGYNWQQMLYWKSLNPDISYIIFGSISDLVTWKTNIDSVKTNKNTIYLMPSPWGTLPNDTLRAFCSQNGYELYSSVAMTKNDLYNVVGFDTGNTLMDINNVYMIKNNIIRYADKVLAQS